MVLVGGGADHVTAPPPPPQKKKEILDPAPFRTHGGLPQVQGDNVRI